MSLQPPTEGTFGDCPPRGSEDPRQGFISLCPPTTGQVSPSGPSSRDPKGVLTQSTWRTTAPCLRSSLVKMSLGNSCRAEERKEKTSSEQRIIFSALEDWDSRACPCFNAESMTLDEKKIISLHSHISTWNLVFPSGKKVGNKPQECEKHKRLGPQQICFHDTLYYIPTVALAHRCNTGRQLDHPL